MSTSELSMKRQLAAHKSWANTPDRSSRTAAAREASHHTRFFDQARRDNPGATEQQIEQVADSLKKAYFKELSLKSAQARRIRVAAAKEAKQKRIAAALAAADAKGAGDAEAA